MVDHLAYRTNDNTRWGAGQGANLTPAQVDINFWDLFSAITALQDHALTNENQIDYFSVVGDQMFVTMMNHEVFGPFTLPTAEWNFRGPWVADTTYGDFDVVTQGGSLYLVIFPHVSASSFNASANDGVGHNFYGLLLASPTPIPTNGTPGQVLTWQGGTGATGVSAPQWENPTRILAVYVEGHVSGPNETVLQYAIPEAMTLPIGLAGSAATQAVAATVEQVFTLYQNGAAIGSINFFPSSITFTFAGAVTFAPGDVITIVGDPSPDGVQSNISITLVAILP